MIIKVWSASNSDNMDPQDCNNASKALNLFIQDIYNTKVIKDKIIPKEMILSSVSYLKENCFKTSKRYLCHTSPVLIY
jgi:uncharacterized circularly permuted ATP-grasp superfamily protein